MKTILTVLLLIIFLGGVGYAIYCYVPWEEPEQDGGSADINAKVDKLSEDCERVTGWYFNYNKKVEALSGKVSGWEATIGDIGEKLSHVASGVSSLSGRLGSQVKSGQRATDIKIGSLKREVETASNQLAQMKTTMTGMRQDLRKLKGDMAPIVSRVSEMGELKIKTRNQAVQISRLKKQVERLADQVDNLRLLMVKGVPNE